MYYLEDENGERVPCPNLGPSQGVMESLGLLPGDRVLLLGDNSSRYVQALLGGLGYLTMVPASLRTPSEQLLQLACRTGVSAILCTDSPSTEQRAMARRLGLRWLDAPPQGISPAAPPQATPLEETPTLLLATSGSTARPRIVPLTLQCLHTAAQGIADSLQLGPQDRCLSVLPLQHIHAISVLLASCLSGGTFLCAPPFEAMRCHQDISRRRASWLSAAPALYRMLLDLGTPPPSHRLRLLRSASAPMPASWQEEIEAYWGCPLIQAYGLTEAGPLVASNGWSPAQRKLGSVGQVRGVELQIDDDGEILIRGDHLPSGYFNDPAASRQRFQQGWIRTGDLGHLDEDGFLHITGRRNELIHQGGEKISPASLEAIFHQHPEVDNVVCYPRPHPVLGQSVAVRILPKTGCRPTFGELSDWASRRLPLGHLPQHWEWAASLPYSPAGKLRRDRLDPHRQALEQAWQEALGGDIPSEESNFFACGGHSLAALRLAQSLSQRLQREFPPHWIYLHPEFPQALSALASENRKLSSVQKRIYTHARLKPEECCYHMAAGLWLQGELDTCRLQVAWQQLVHLHPILRSQLALQPDGTPLARLEARGLELEIGSAATLESLLENEWQRPFELHQAPLIRTLLWRESERRHFLLVMAHHLIFDGWSRALLLRQLAALYLGQQVAAPRAYFDYQESIQALEQRHAPYWREVCRDRPDPLPLSAVEGPAPSISLTAEQAAALRQRAADWQTTPFVLWLCLLQHYLRRKCQQQRFLLGVAQWGRPDLESLQVIGPFAQTLPLVCQPGAKLNRREVARVHQEMLAHAQHAFVEAGHSWLPEVMFSYQNSPLEPFPEGTLGFQEQRLFPPISKFLRTLYVEDDGQRMTAHWVGGDPLEAQALQDDLRQLLS